MIERDLGSLAAEKAKLVRLNAAKLYKIDSPRLLRPCNQPGKRCRIADRTDEDLSTRDFSDRRQRGIVIGVIGYLFHKFYVLNSIRGINHEYRTREQL